MKPKKLMGILLAVATAVMMVPGMSQMAYAADESFIEEVGFSIQAPAADTEVTSSYNAEEKTDLEQWSQDITPDVTTAEGPYGLLDAFWVNDDGSPTGTPYSGLLEAGQTYTALVVLVRAEGSIFGTETVFNVEGGTNARTNDPEPAYLLPVMVDVTIEGSDEESVTFEFTVGEIPCGYAVDVTAEDHEEWVEYTYSPEPDVTVPDGASYGIVGLYWLTAPEGEATSPYDYTELNESTVYYGGDTAYIGVVFAADWQPFDPDDPALQPMEDGDSDLPAVTANGAEVVAYDFMEEVYAAVLAVEVEHVPGETVTENVVEPKCLEDGSHDEVVYCQNCGAELSRETVADAALGHDWGEWAVTKEAQVGVAGEEQRVCRRDASHVETRPTDPLEAEETTAPETTPATPPNGPVTGDTTRVGIWAGVAAAACVGAVGAAVYTKKRRS